MRGVPRVGRLVAGEAASGMQLCAPTKQAVICFTSASSCSLRSWPLLSPPSAMLRLCSCLQAPRRCTSRSSFAQASYRSQQDVSLCVAKLMADTLFEACVHNRTTPPRDFITDRTKCTTM